MSSPSLSSRLFPALSLLGAPFVSVLSPPLLSAGALSRTGALRTAVKLRRSVCDEIPGALGANSCTPARAEQIVHCPRERIDGHEPEPAGMLIWNYLSAVNVLILDVEPLERG